MSTALLRENLVVDLLRVLELSLHPRGFCFEENEFEVMKIVMGRNVGDKGGIGRGERSVEEGMLEEKRGECKEPALGD